MKIQITIEPGKYTGKAIIWLQRHRVSTGILALLLSFVALWAAPITKPFTFSNGGVVSASEMNQNFDTLYTKVNILDQKDLRFPDGMNGTAIVNTGGAVYAVPAGKTLYILSIGGSLTRSGFVICFSGFTGCIIEAGASIAGDFTGMLVDSSATVINNLDGNYTVPAGKTLFLLTVAQNVSVGGTVVRSTGSTMTGVFPTGTTLTWAANNWITGYLR